MISTIFLLCLLAASSGVLYVFEDREKKKRRKNKLS